MKKGALPRYVLLEKRVGETPLSCAEAWRATQSPALENTPLAYAGRLDPLASGSLLVLIGEECKHQEHYHKLDKAYEFSVLFGVGSDTGDVMGRLSLPAYNKKLLDKNTILKTAKQLTGEVSLPYPIFSSRTVKGKPLHTWAMEGRLNEIEIPTATTTIYKLKLEKLETKMRAAVYTEALAKINSIPKVTEERKALGNDFRRTDIRADWQKFRDAGHDTDRFLIAHFSCVASSGSYMRSLATAMGEITGEKALAYHIHRTTIGKYQSVPLIGGFWRKRF